MNMVIKKFLIPSEEIVLDGTEIEIPAYGLVEPLGVSEDSGKLYIDAFADTESGPGIVRCRVFCTENSVWETIESGFGYVGSANIGGVTNYVFCENNEPTSD